MYEYISGSIAEVSPTYVVIDAGGVGYYINISLQTFSEIEQLEQTKIFTHYIVRDDAQILFGFATKAEREMFRLLINVSGVGGNTARMVLSTYSTREVASIIATGNATLLKNVKGLGIKTAQKIIVELRDKVTGLAMTSTPDAMASEVVSSVENTDVYKEALMALTMLGFGKGASDKAVKIVLKNNPNISVEDLIRESLKKM